MAHGRSVLGDSHVTALAVAPNGDVWVGHHFVGVSRWDGVRWRTYTEEDGLPQDSVWAIAVGPDGVVWIGTEGEGLWRFEPAE